MTAINESFLKEWRENYHWPFHATRKDSEERIFGLESAVIENIIIKQGNRTTKQILSDIVDWKTSSRQVERFNENDPDEIRAVVDHVLETIANRPDAASECIQAFVFENALQGVRIPVASAILRFLDPKNHRYGIIDKNIAHFLDMEGITRFQYENDGLAKTCYNLDEYQRFHSWLQKKTTELRNSTFTNIHNAQIEWAPVDVEMALFAYCTRSHVKATEKIDSRAEINRCPKCGSPLTWHKARLTGESYRGCTNYPDCNYNERSY